MVFDVQATPGPRAGAAFIESQEGRPLLLLDLDPVRVWLEVPPATAGPRVMAAFLRQVSRVSAQMAQRVDELAMPAGASVESGGPAVGNRSRHSDRRGLQAGGGAV